jgi:lysophospholipase L1-like esterase
MTRHRRISAILAATFLVLAACGGGPGSRDNTPSADGLSIVTIGDSIAYARETCDGCPSFTTLFEQMLSDDTSTHVTSQNLSNPAPLISLRLLDRIKNSEPLREAVADADIVIVSTGHDDTPWNAIDDGCDGADVVDVLTWKLYTGPCVVQVAQRHEDELKAILDEVESLRDGEPTAVRVLTDYNDIIGWEHAAPGSTDTSVEVLDAFHDATCKAAEAHGAVCVDVYHAFNGADGRKAAGDLLADDYLHPSAKGQKRIAELLMDAGIAPLTP